MTAEVFTPTRGIKVTPAAAEHIRQQLGKHPEAIGFRIGVKKSGCSGFMYVVDLVQKPDAQDQIFTLENGVDIIIDTQSLPVVNGTVLDFVKVGLNSSFRFDNPNTAASCGCGESFSIRSENE